MSKAAVLNPKVSRLKISSGGASLLPYQVTNLGISCLTAVNLTPHVGSSFTFLATTDEVRTHSFEAKVSATTPQMGHVPCGIGS